jgi:hypothetical protein
LEAAHCFSGDQVPLDIEGIVDRAVNGNEALGLPLGLEALHFPFSSSDWQMRIFSPIVVPQSTWLMAINTTQDLHRASV